MKQIREFLESFVVVILVVAGLVGISYHTFRGGGWFDAAFARLMEIIFQNVVTSVVVAAIIAVVFVMWNDWRLAKGTHFKRVPTVILYILMAAGAYFVGHYALRGTL